MNRIIFFSIVITAFSLFLPSVTGQVISQFDWDNNPITQATVGPNATSSSGSAVSDAGGSTGNGLNPSLPKADLDFTIPGSPTFDVENIEVQFDYQREESDAFFFERGSNFFIRMSGGNISIAYRVENGAGGFIDVAASGIFAIPYDDVFRTYKLSYDSDSGTGNFEVNGVSVWTNDGPDNLKLYWSGAGDVMIGRLLDGSGSDKTCLDNFIISAPISASLPVELAFFDVSPKNNWAKIEWQTAAELNNHFFTIERSFDGKNWEKLAEVLGAGNSDKTNTYSITDNTPLKGLSYYRLKQNDFDGSFAYSELRSVRFDNDIHIKVFPNPVVNELKIQSEKIEEYSIQVFNQVGQSVTVQIDENGGVYRVDMSQLNSGVYLLQLIDEQRRITTKKIVKK